MDKRMEKIIEKLGTVEDLLFLKAHTERVGAAQARTEFFEFFPELTDHVEELAIGDDNVAAIERLTGLGRDEIHSRFREWAKAAA